MGLPTGTEFLNVVISQYISDFISWGVIGARTTESQTHREMASAFPFPIGFKNSTDGNTHIAIDAIRAAQNQHSFPVPDRKGNLVIFSSAGNPHGHVVMRGGKSPNFYSSDISNVCKNLTEHSLPERLVVDFSHGNSRKIHHKQLDVAKDICRQIHEGSNYIAGVMAESFLVGGEQKLEDKKSLTYGQSVTDPCLGWSDTEKLLSMLADAVDSRF
ncbi:3-deoxy-7-phosphoheptulonate synthase [Microbulbifer sp. ANSA003]|uniref:3-deoxy-7-phosphoheptulonate synthase n=1 Tax=Microbulbifer sp. ANSA003 TaxID=3243360 RepID=UPI0040424B70